MYFVVIFNPFVDIVLNSKPLIIDSFIQIVVVFEDINLPSICTFKKNTNHDIS